MSNDLSVAESNALSVVYEVSGQKVSLDMAFVKKYLVRGKSEYDAVALPAAWETVAV